MVASFRSGSRFRFWFAMGEASVNRCRVDGCCGQLPGCPGAWSGYYGVAILGSIRYGIYTVWLLRSIWSLRDALSRRCGFRASRMESSPEITCALAEAAMSAGIRGIFSMRLVLGSMSIGLITPIRKLSTRGGRCSARISRTPRCSDLLHDRTGVLRPYSIPADSTSCIRRGGGRPFCQHGLIRPR